MYCFKVYTVKRVNYYDVFILAYDKMVRLKRYAMSTSIWKHRLITRYGLILIVNNIIYTYHHLSQEASQLLSLISI